MLPGTSLQHSTIGHDLPSTPEVHPQRNYQRIFDFDLAIFHYILDHGIRLLPHFFSRVGHEPGESLLNPHAPFSTSHGHSSNSAPLPCPRSNLNRPVSIAFSLRTLITCSCMIRALQPHSLFVILAA